MPERSTRASTGSCRALACSLESSRSAAKTGRGVARVLESVHEEIKVSDWYSDGWLDDVFAQVGLRFDRDCNRWRELYCAAARQRRVRGLPAALLLAAAAGRNSLPRPLNHRLGDVVGHQALEGPQLPTLTAPEDLVEQRHRDVNTTGEALDPLIVALYQDVGTKQCCRSSASPSSSCSSGPGGRSVHCAGATSS